MSYTILATIFLATFALSSSKFLVNDDQNVFARFYPDFVQLYRPAKPISNVEEEQPVERYRFVFTEKEYSRIPEESITMLNTNVLERTITFHSMPNFEVNGSRYFYRPDPKQNDFIEIELVDVENRVFREVEQPNRYFYASNFDDLRYANRMPVKPYYEVIFVCNSTFPQKFQNQPPLLSYIDRSFQYSPRYLLDLSLFGLNKQSQLQAYADIRNNGRRTIVVKAAELIVGDVVLNRQPSEYLRIGLQNVGVVSSSQSTVRSLNDQTTDTFTYPLLISSSMNLPPRTLKSVQFLDANVTIEPFICYVSVFTPNNSTDHLLNAYNLTSVDNFLPGGRLILRENGRFLGQIDLPDLSVNETYTVIMDQDSDVSYRRQVRILNDNDDNDLIKTYRVEYIFENVKSTRDVRLYFTEVFNSYKNFRIENLSISTSENNFPEQVFSGSNLCGYLVIPRENGQVKMCYDLIISQHRSRF